MVAVSACIHPIRIGNECVNDRRVPLAKSGCFIYVDNTSYHQQDVRLMR